MTDEQYGELMNVLGEITVLLTRCATALENPPGIGEERPGPDPRLFEIAQEYQRLEAEVKAAQVALDTYAGAEAAEQRDGVGVDRKEQARRDAARERLSAAQGALAAFEAEHEEVIHGADA